MEFCESCGMPMRKPSDHGGGKPFNSYCRNCTDEDGNLKSKEEIIRGWVRFSMESEGLPREEAEIRVEEQMSKMPAWKDFEEKIEEELNNNG